MSKIKIKNQEMIQVDERMGIDSPYSKTISENNMQDALKFEMQKRLRDLGLTKNESKIYMFLSKKGPKKGKEISKEQNIPRTEIYYLISNLKNKGFITPSIDRPQKFLAITIDKAIESVIETEQKRIENLKLSTKEMEEIWNSFQGIMPRREFSFNNFKLSE